MSQLGGEPRARLEGGPGVVPPGQSPSTRSASPQGTGDGKVPPGQGQECLQELRLQRTSVLTALGSRQEDPESSDGCGPAPQHFQLYFSLYKTLG